MSTNLGEEDILRKKVWKIINLTQANQLFVHYKELGIKYFAENSKNSNILVFWFQPSFIQPSFFLFLWL